MTRKMEDLATKIKFARTLAPSTQPIPAAVVPIFIISASALMTPLVSNLSSHLIIRGGKTRETTSADGLHTHRKISSTICCSRHRYRMTTLLKMS